MALTNVNAIAKRLASLGFHWQGIQEPYKGTDGYIEYTDGVGVECAANEHALRVSRRAKDFPTRRTIEAVAKAVSSIFMSTGGRTGPLRRVESPFNSKQGSNFAFAKLPVSVRV